MSSGRRSLLLVAIVASLQVEGTARAADVRYGVALRTDARTRSPLPGDVGVGVTGDLEVSPRGDVSLGIDVSTLSLQYAPTLVWREPQVAGGRLLPLHRGRLALQTVWSRATLVVSEDAAYGVADLGFSRALDDNLPPSAAQVQSIASVPFVRSASMVSVESQPSGRFSLGASAGFLVSGSTDESQAMPLQWGPVASVRARAAATRTDGLTTLGQVSSARFVTGQEQFISQLWEIWDRQVSRTVTLNVGAGAALTRELITVQQGIPGEYVDLLPVGLASLAWRDVVENTPLRFSTSLRMAPFADRFTASVYERVEARLQGEWQPARDWAVMAATSGALAVPLSLSLAKPDAATAAGSSGTNQAGDRLLSAEGSVGWTVKTWLLLQASARVLWTEQPRLGIPGMVQAVGSVSVTVQQQDSLAW